MTTVREYVAATDREMAEWPGVQWAYGKSARHQTVTVAFGAASRKVIFATSASDRRGVANHLGVLRRSLVEIGAARKTPTTAGVRKAKRPRVDRPAASPSGTDARRSMADLLAGAQGRRPPSIIVPNASGRFNAAIADWTRERAEQAKRRKARRLAFGLLIFDRLTKISARAAS